MYLALGKDNIGGIFSMSILQYISVTTYFPGTDCYIVANPLVSCNIVSAQQLRETNRWKDVIVLI